MKIELDEDWVNEDGDEEVEIPDYFDCIEHHFRFLPRNHAWAETRSQLAPDADDIGEWFTSVTFLDEGFLRPSCSDFPKATKSQQLRFLYF